MIRKFITLFIFLCTIFFAIPSMAQDTAQCTGDPQMCAQIMELRGELKLQRDLAAKQAEIKAIDAQKAADLEATKTAKLMGIAALIAVILKILISIAKSWIGFFKTDKGVATIKIGTLILGFVAFILTNIGAGVKWWQALIVAGGPPAAILVHELMDLVPVVQGKKKLSDVHDEHLEDH